MNAIENSLNGFRKIDLEHMNPAGLMKRFDTKFMVHVEQLPFLLNFLHADYDILEIGNKRIFQYQTLYYDTADYHFYHQHHDQRLSRYKIRCRNYVDSGQIYFEVKCKTNKKKTVKERMLLNDTEIRPELSEASLAFARNCMEPKSRPKVNEISPSLWTSYSRMTLARPLNRERITFDVNLTFSDNSRLLKLNHLAIVEFKYFRSLVKPDFFQMLKKLNILPVQFSKYCMGVVLMGKAVKHNRFKKNLLHLNKMGRISYENQFMMDGNPEWSEPEQVLVPSAS